MNGQLGHDQLPPTSAPNTGEVDQQHLAVLPPHFQNDHGSLQALQQSGRALRAVMNDLTDTPNRSAKSTAPGSPRMYVFRLYPCLATFNLASFALWPFAMLSAKLE